MLWRCWFGWHTWRVEPWRLKGCALRQCETCGRRQRRWRTLGQPKWTNR